MAAQKTEKILIFLVVIAIIVVLIGNIITSFYHDELIDRQEKMYRQLQNHTRITEAIGTAPQENKKLLEENKIMIQELLNRTK